MLGEMEKQLIEEVKEKLLESVKKFPIESVTDFSGNTSELITLKAQMERVIGGLTCGEPFYNFCAATIAFCDEQIAMSNLFVGSIRGMKGAQTKFLKEIDGILGEET